jgi:hypothetical protein
MSYTQHIETEVMEWRRRMTRKPSMMNKLSKRVQTKVNSYIPERVHKAITTAIKQMIRGVMFGSGYTTSEKPAQGTMMEVEEAVIKRINHYKHAAAAEGGITGAGGILLGLADFPLFLSIKLKMLFDIAALYGYSPKDYKERLASSTVARCLN